MILSDDHVKALNFDHPGTIPASVFILPSAWIKYREQLEDIVKRHPALFPGSAQEDRDYDAVTNPTYTTGEHVDVWGCVWSNVHQGQESIVTRHPLPNREDIHRLTMPARDAGLPHGFMYLRLLDLRGFEEAMVDFAEEPSELQQVIDIVLAYNLRQLDLQLAKQPKDDMFWFGDDLGTQHALPISPAKWRRYLKPCYQALYARWRADGRTVYMHTDGHILSI